MVLFVSGRRLRAGVALAGVAPFTLVGANVPVSSDAVLRGNGQQAEPSLAIDPPDPPPPAPGAPAGRAAAEGPRGGGRAAGGGLLRPPRGRRELVARARPRPDARRRRSLPARHRPVGGL